MAHGTGLGLPLVKHIVETVHRGRVFVESQAGQVLQEVALADPEATTDNEPARRTGCGSRTELGELVLDRALAAAEDGDSVAAGYAGA